MTQPTKKASTKQYYLSAEETNNIQGRKQFLNYIKDLAERDISMYLYGNVIQRLKLPEDIKFTLSEDSKSIEVEEENGISISK